MALPQGVDLGHYRILRKLGQGGFGITYLAQNTQTGEQVVIKENLPTFYATRDDATWSILPLDVEDAAGNYKHTLMRFVDEARLLARLHHPNIVRVSEAFEALGTAYYVMPHITGQELHKAAPAVVTEEWLLPILRTLLSALEYLHSQNLLHRDIKPGNILLRDDGSPVLIDFGTARALQSERSATMVGTPGYTPIEQISAHGHCGAWTDIYALGATCYRVITGERPPEANTRLAEDEDPYEPLQNRAELLSRFSPATLQSIDVALAVRAKNRWQSATDWLHALAQTSGRLAVAPSVPMSSAMPPVRKKSMWPLILGIVGVAAIPGGYWAYTYVDALIKKNKLTQQALSEAELRKLEIEEQRRREACAAQAAREEECNDYANRLCAQFDKVLMPSAGSLPNVWPTSMVDTLRVLADSSQGGERYSFVYGVVLVHGLGVDADSEQGVRYIRSAAERGLVQAQLFMAAMCSEGRWVAKDEAHAAIWFQKAAVQGNALAQFHRAECCRKGIGTNKDADEAAEWYKKAAEQGYPEAQFRWAECYRYGHGVKKDASLAVEWYRKAADSGNAGAQCGLAEMYEKGLGVLKDSGEAVRRYRHVAEQGNALGQCHLGRCYLYGIGVAKDAEAAVRWFLRAAEQKHAGACYYLGKCCESGEGAAQNTAEAIRWYQKAAEQGHAAALCHLGEFYEIGRGVSKDREEAFSLYRKSADKGYPTAQFNVGVCCEHGLGVQKDEREAVKWYEKSAEAGYSMGQYMLASCYAAGRGVSKDAATAVKWYRKAAEQGLPGAQFCLAGCYASGEGVSQDDGEAAKWYRKAAEQGHAGAQVCLGECYENGTGVSRDAALAGGWYRKAAELGNAAGQVRLGRCYELGSGLPTDRDEARKWYRRAAQQGNNEAQGYLDNM